MRERWMWEIEQPPSENVSSYCRSCNTFTYWKVWNRWPDRTLKCNSCDRKVRVN